MRQEHLFLEQRVSRRRLGESRRDEVAVGEFAVREPPAAGEDPRPAVPKAPRSTRRTFGRARAEMTGPSQILAPRRDRRRASASIFATSRAIRSSATASST